LTVQPAIASVAAEPLLTPPPAPERVWLLLRVQSVSEAVPPKLQRPAPDALLATLPVTVLWLSVTSPPKLMRAPPPAWAVSALKVQPLDVTAPTL
jgi:hypothetical protein